MMQLGWPYEYLLLAFVSKVHNICNVRYNCIFHGHFKLT